MRPTIAALLLVTAGLAGCTGGSDTAQTASTGPGSPGNGTDDDQDRPSQRGTDAGEGTPGDEQDNTTDPVRIERVWTNGTVQGAGTAQAQVYLNHDASLKFPVEKNASAIVLEAVWNASHELSLHATPPDTYCNATIDRGPISYGKTCPEGGQDSGSSPLQVVVTADDKLDLVGEWTGDVELRGPAPQAFEVTLVASLAYGPVTPEELAQLDSTR